ncbi:SCO2322 family protein [Streptomyces sp. NPDC050856]|uniref:SCO2322 family protein n=1 Tax=Streptomyces sp. NPDC050856 TaxID=3154939 RepID=UPI0033F7030B
MRVRLLALLLALGAALGALGAGAGPAQAAGYRYWSFWQGGEGGRWSYATQGPAVVRPDDGEVNGYRFAVSPDSRSAAQPRRAPDFRALCGTTPAKDGIKRVGLVIDFGTPADAPAGATPPAPRTACVRVPDDATSADVLAVVAKPLRYNIDALLCAISGYPRTGCGEQVAGSTGPGPTASGGPAGESAGPGATSGRSAQDRPGGGPSAGLVAGLAAVLALGAAAVWQARRRRR